MRKISLKTFICLCAAMALIIFSLIFGSQSALPWNIENTSNANQAINTASLPTLAEAPLTLMVATDLHYIAPTLTDHGAYFRQVIDDADGKIMLYSEELIDAFVEEAIRKKPDAVILSGDLTFNGARESHQALIERLSKIRDAGIPVLAISGNHDLNNPNAARFVGDSFIRVEQETPEEFVTDYYDFGPALATEFMNKGSISTSVAEDETISTSAAEGETTNPNRKDQSINSSKAFSLRAPDSMSYFVPLRKDFGILMLDTNSVQENHVSDETLAWVENTLKAADEGGIGVITVSHQNLRQHSPLFSYGFQIAEHEALEKLYQKYHVIANLAGHLHIQHILGKIDADNAGSSDEPRSANASISGSAASADTTAGNISTPEILTSALSIYPLQYGMITVTEHELSYQTESLQLTKYVAEHLHDNHLTLDPNLDPDDPNLQNLEDYALQYFRQKPLQSTKRDYASAFANASDLDIAAETFADLNTAYFSGDAIDLEKEAYGIALWDRVPADMTAYYISTIVDDRKANPEGHHRISLDF